MKKRLVRVVPLFVLCACGSSTKPPTTTNPAVADASPDIALVPLNADGACRALSLDEFQVGAGGFCPPTMAEIAGLPCGSYEMRSSGACAPERSVLRRTVNMSGVACYYSTNTGELVGASRSEDVPMFCNNTNRTLSAGETPACTEASPATSTCFPDGGYLSDGSLPQSLANSDASSTVSPPVDASGYCPASTPDADPVCCSSNLDEFKCRDGSRWCCPLTKAEADSYPCQAMEMRYSSDCGSHHGLLVRNFGIFVVSCYYSSTSGDLVGAYNFNDTPMFCSRTSNSILVGDHPACGYPPKDPFCSPDGGT
jgi:hypothetical protein